MRGQKLRQSVRTVLWEDGEFDGPVWSGSVMTSEEEEEEYLLKESMLVLGTGVVVTSGVKEKCPRAF